MLCWRHLAVLPASVTMVYADTEMKRKAIQQAANKLNDTIPDVLWNTDDEEMMLKLRGKQQYK